MKVYYKNQTEKFKNSEKCAITSHPQIDRDINCVVATISGRYPDTGSAVNTECKELAYIYKGSGIRSTR